MRWPSRSLIGQHVRWPRLIQSPLTGIQAFARLDNEPNDTTSVPVRSSADDHKRACVCMRMDHSVFDHIIRPRPRIELTAQPEKGTNVEFADPSNAFMSGHLSSAPDGNNNPSPTFLCSRTLRDGSYDMCNYYPPSLSL